MLRRSRLAAVGAAVIALGLLIPVAWATPPSGQGASGLTVGTLDDSVMVNIDRIKLQTKDRVDVAMFTVTYAPSGYSGWHTHPGVVIVNVVSGSVIRTVGCGSTTYGPGDTFVESDEQPAGQVSNASNTTAAVLGVTQIYPTGAPRRAEADPPTC